MPKNETLLIGLVYGVAHGPLLLNGGIYWDDWFLVRSSPQDLVHYFGQMGAKTTAYLHNALLSMPMPVGLYRLLAFLSFLFSALFLKDVLRTLQAVDERSRFFIVAFFALFPVNNVRLALINLPGALAFCAFFSGFWLVSRYLQGGRPVFRLAALACFWCSFLVNSFLPFFGVVALYIFYMERGRLASWRGFGRVAARYADFLASPFLFWALKQALVVPYGAGVSYNRLNLDPMVVAANIAAFFKGSFAGVLDRALAASSIPAVLLAFLLALAADRLLPAAGEREKYGPALPLLLAGLLAFLLGVFPYAAVNKVGSADDWIGRFELLVPLGAGLMLWSIVTVLSDALGVNAQGKTLLCSLLAALFVGQNLASYLAWQRDYYKQCALIVGLAADGKVRERPDIAVSDLARGLDANRRFYREYEWEGIADYASGDDPYVGRGGLRLKGLRGRAFHRLREAGEPAAGPVLAIQVKHGVFDVTIPDFRWVYLNTIDGASVIRLMVSEFFRPGRFPQRVGRLLNVEVAEQG